MLIRTRLILIGLLPVLLFLLFIAGMMVTQRQLDSFREKVIFASHIEKNFFDLFVIAHDIKEKNRFERSRQQWSPITRELGQQLPKARGMFSSADESELIETLLEYFEDSQRDFRELEQWLDRHQGRTLNAAQQDYLSSLSERLHVSLQSAIPIANRIAAINQESAVAFDQRRENALAFALVFLAGVLLLILWPLMRGITRSVDQLKTGMNQAAFGDLESRIAMTGKDELAQLARHFNAMISTLAEVTVAREVLSAEVTERKLAEEKLLKSEANMRAILDNMPYLAWLKDMAGQYIAVNEALFKTTGQKRMQDVLGKTDLDLWPKELAEKYRADDAEVMALRQQKYIEEPAFDGDKTYWVETFKTPVIDESGNVLGTTGLARDITERREHEEELKRSNAELEQFSYAVSHDMRQPLRVISSYLQLLEMGLADQLDSEKRSYFDFAIDGAKRIDQMLVALLEYSRVGKMGEPPTWVESRAVLDEALQFTQPAIAEAQAKLTITGDWPRILASHDEIQRLLQNLIGNAAKFCVIGRIPEIMVASEVVKNEWHLSVTDNGVGIIHDQINRLFHVFQRLHSRDAYAGTGIGLALCRKIAEHHKGRIWAESAGEGQGSRFCVALPVLREKI